MSDVRIEVCSLWLMGRVQVMGIRVGFDLFICICFGVTVLFGFVKL